VKLIAQEWASYVERVMPPDAPSLQHQEMRRAFYAGVASLFFLQMKMLDPGSEDATEADLARMDSIHAELAQFEADVRRGRA
jgi:hypothetical protein